MSEKLANGHLMERLAKRGLRFTSQREHVYTVLMEERDHPTAEQVFLRAKKSIPDISIATVYNCLDAMVKCRLVKALHLDRGATRYCPNMQEHYHFYCSKCEGVFDIDLPAGGEAPLRLPPGFQPMHYDIAVRGLCPSCGRRNANGL